MPVYRAKIAGRRKPLLIKADSAAAAREALIELEPLSAKETSDLFDGDERPWKKGQPLPADDPEPEGETGENA